MHLLVDAALLDVLVLGGDEGPDGKEITRRLAGAQHHIPYASNERLNNILDPVQPLLGAQAPDEHDGCELLGDAVIDDMLEDLDGSLGLLVVDPGDELGPVHVYPNQDTVPLVAIQALAHRQTRRVLAKHVDDLQLALLHDHVESVRLETLRPVLHAVVDQQTVRKLRTELERDLAAQSVDEFLLNLNEHRGSLFF